MPQSIVVWGYNEIFYNVIIFESIFSSFNTINTSSCLFTSIIIPQSSLITTHFLHYYCVIYSQMLSRHLSKKHPDIKQNIRECHEMVKMLSYYILCKLEFSKRCMRSYFMYPSVNQYILITLTG